MSVVLTFPFFPHVAIHVPLDATVPLDALLFCSFTLTIQLKCLNDCINKNVHFALACSRCNVVLGVLLVDLHWLDLLLPGWHHRWRWQLPGCSWDPQGAGGLQDLCNGYTWPLIFRCSQAHRGICNWWGKHGSWILNFSLGGLGFYKQRAFSWLDY